MLNGLHDAVRNNREDIVRALVDDELVDIGRTALVMVFPRGRPRNILGI